MLLLTDATETVGLPVVRRLTAARVVRRLVRDPRRLGAQADVERLGVLPQPTQAVLDVG